MKLRNLFIGAAVGAIAILGAANVVAGWDTEKCDNEYKDCTANCQEGSVEYGTCIINCQTCRDECYEDLKKR